MRKKILGESEPAKTKFSFSANTAINVCTYILVIGTQDILNTGTAVPVILQVLIYGCVRRVNSSRTTKKLYHKIDS